MGWFGLIGVLSFKPIVVPPCHSTAIQMLKDQKPVWFGCDVGKCYSRSAAIMDTEYYDWESSFGTSLKQNKVREEEREVDGG